jgi:hypothetical protein
MRLQRVQRFSWISEMPAQRMRWLSGLPEMGARRVSTRFVTFIFFVVAMDAASGAILKAFPS